jgi:serine/threonine protein kinase
MSNVFLTEDIRNGRIVALKLLAPRVVADETYRLRLLREAHAVASLKHPNITALYEADQFQDQPYLAIEYVDGESVSDRLISGPFSVSESVRITADTANALEAAHNRSKDCLRFLFKFLTNSCLYSRVRHKTFSSDNLQRITQMTRIIYVFVEGGRQCQHRLRGFR